MIARLLPSLTLLLTSIAMAAILVQFNSQGVTDQTLVIFKPGTHFSANYQALAQEDVTIIRRGGFDFILVIEGNSHAVRQKTKDAGAFVTMPSPILGGCFFTRNKKS